MLREKHIRTVIRNKKNNSAMLFNDLTPVISGCKNTSCWSGFMRPIFALSLEKYLHGVFDMLSKVMATSQ